MWNVIVYFIFCFFQKTEIKILVKVTYILTFLFIIHVKEILHCFTNSIMSCVTAAENRSIFFVFLNVNLETSQHLQAPTCHILFIFHVQQHTVRWPLPTVILACGPVGVKSIDRCSTTGFPHRLGNCCCFRLLCR